MARFSGTECILDVFDGGGRVKKRPANNVKKCSELVVHLYHLVRVLVARWLVSSMTIDSHSHTRIHIIHIEGVPSCQLAATALTIRLSISVMDDEITNKGTTRPVPPLNRER